MRGLDYCGQKLNNPTDFEKRCLLNSSLGDFLPSPSCGREMVHLCFPIFFQRKQEPQQFKLQQSRGNQVTQGLDFCRQKLNNPTDIEKRCMLNSPLGDFFPSPSCDRERREMIHACFPILLQPKKSCSSGNWVLRVLDFCGQKLNNPSDFEKRCLLNSSLGDFFCLLLPVTER